MELFFFVAKNNRIPSQMKAHCFIQNCFKCDYDHYKVLSVIMTITSQSRPTAEFDNARITSGMTMCCVCKLDI